MTEQAISKDILELSEDVMLNGETVMPNLIRHLFFQTLNQFQGDKPRFSQNLFVLLRFFSPIDQYEIHR